MDYREMKAIGSDAARVRALATILTGTQGLSESAYSLLRWLKNYDGSKPLTTRQLEALYVIRESATRKSSAGGYRADYLVRLVWEARLDLLDEDAEDWLTELHNRGEGLALSTREWRRLLALARGLDGDIVAPDRWIEL